MEGFINVCDWQLESENILGIRSKRIELEIFAYMMRHLKLKIRRHICQMPVGSDVIRLHNLVTTDYIVTYYSSRMVAMGVPGYPSYPIG